MTNFSRIAIIAAGLGSGIAMAADSANLNVSATVLDSCGFDASDYDFAFGTVSAGAGDYTLNQTVTVNCTSGTAYSVTGPAGPFTMDDGSGNTMAYSIAFDGATGAGAFPITGTGTGAIDVEVTLPETSIIGAVPGSYTDTQTIDVTP